MKNFTSPTQKIGELGEDIACRWLGKKGFTIIDRNYTKKWGEIDIVAERRGVTHFVEVKSSKRTLSKNEKISDLNGNPNNYNPAENMHEWKIKRLARAIQTYLMTSKGQKINQSVGGWQVDLLIVYLDLDKKFARCEVFEKIM